MIKEVIKETYDIELTEKQIEDIFRFLDPFPSPIMIRKHFHAHLGFNGSAFVDERTKKTIQAKARKRGYL